jgi:hypothetical protein
MAAFLRAWVSSEQYALVDLADDHFSLFNGIYLVEVYWPDG